jgi:hypothetical protein
VEKNEKDRKDENAEHQENLTSGPLQLVCARCGVCACFSCFNERKDYSPFPGKPKCRVCSYPDRVPKAEYWKRKEN